ncbi:MAG: hypothetical protein Sylvanvirus33_2 [Sylvanvirus sp.]|uniref:Uncharacterized protein n=1 Tax=Sylvanvirus sp. TaxID=2487774 RepID=A0A3G5AJ39_9VIRU|nr:MAG: hypothetical protein Sylvanvirus33_2 [Sylvanvirus sp.]
MSFAAPLSRVAPTQNPRPIIQINPPLSDQPRRNLPAGNVAARVNSIRNPSEQSVLITPTPAPRSVIIQPSRRIAQTPVSEPIQTIQPIQSLQQLQPSNQPLRIVPPISRTNGLSSRPLPAAQIEQPYEISNPMYMDTRRLNPMLHQFTDLVHANRTRGRRQGGVDTRLIGGMRRLDEEKKALEQQLQDAKQEVKREADVIAQQIEVKAPGAVKQVVLHPLYTYYSETEIQNKTFPNYAYFMGLSQIMLDAISDIAQHMSQACTNVSDIGQDWREVLSHFESCKSDQTDRLRGILSSSNVASMPQEMIRFLVDPLPRGLQIEDMSYAQSIISNLFLTQELQEETKVLEELGNDYTRASADAVEFNEQDHPEVREGLRAIGSEYRDSGLRLNIIEQIQALVPSLLRSLFTGTPYTPGPITLRQQRAGVNPQYTYDDETY